MQVIEQQFINFRHRDSAWMSEVPLRSHARREQAERDGRADEADDMMATFFHDVPPDLAAEAVKRDRSQVGTPFEKPWPLKAWPEVPTKFLLGRDDRLEAYLPGSRSRAAYGAAPRA
jgi:hypothetical protein